MNVWYGSGQNAEFSNLAERPFTYRGRSYISVEHAYQTLKSGRFVEATYSLPWRSGSKFRGERARTDGDWNLRLMQTLIWESFSQNPAAANRLLGTHGTITHNSPSGRRDIWTTAFPVFLLLVRSGLKLSTPICLIQHLMLNAISDL